MKKINFFHIAVSFVTCCFITNASKAADLEDLKELQTIVMPSLQLPTYQSETFTCKEIPVAYHQNESPLLYIPNEVLLRVLFHSDANTLLLGWFRSCKKLHILTQSPMYYLTDEDSTEFKPHVIPPFVLNLKIRNTRDSIYKIASLYSVSQENLIEWVGVDFLSKAAKKKSLPALELNTPHDVIKDLYSVCKVLLAAGGEEREKALNLIQKDAFIVNNQPGSPTLYQLHTLVPGWEPYYSFGFSIIFDVFALKPEIPRDCQPKGVIAREILLIAGNSTEGVEAQKYNVSHVTHTYYVPHYLAQKKSSQENEDQKEELCHKLVQWVIKKTSDAEQLRLAVEDSKALSLLKLAVEGDEKIKKLPH